MPEDAAGSGARAERKPSPLHPRALVPDTIAKALSQGTVVGLGTLIGLAIKYHDSTVFWLIGLSLTTVAAAGAALTLGVLYRRNKEHLTVSTSDLSTTSSVDDQTRAVPDAARAVAVVHEDLESLEPNYAGIDLGRHQISYGVLSVEAQAGSGCLPRQSASILEEHRKERPTRGRHILEDIVKVVANLRVEDVAGIGIGIPAEVDPVAGRVEGLPAGWSKLRNFRQDLAFLIASDWQASRRLGVATEGSIQARANAIEAKIRLDNDVNCAARALLNDYNQDDSCWSNFACIYIGRTGVGAGLVFNRCIYYGSGGTAGEVGHITVPQSSRYVHHVHHIHPPCECGKDVDGPHWQPLVSGDGLLELAATLDSTIQGRLMNSSPEAGGDPLRAFISGLARASSTAIGEEDEIKSAAGDLRTEPLIREYAGSVLLGHARVVASGIASLMNVLDLDHIVLGGGVIDGLWELDIPVDPPPYRTYCEAIIEQVGQRTMSVTGQRIFEKIRSVGPAKRTTYSWQGAALAFSDESYPVP